MNPPKPGFFVRPFGLPDQRLIGIPEPGAPVGIGGWRPKPVNPLTAPPIAPLIPPKMSPKSPGSPV